MTRKPWPRACQSFGSPLKFEDDLDPLLVDTERRDLRPGRRFDLLDDGGDGRAAPAGDQGLGPLVYAHRIARQQIDRDLEICRIADLQDRRAGQDDLFVLGQHAQHAARDRRDEFDTAGFCMDSDSYADDGLGAFIFAFAHGEIGARTVQSGLGGLLFQDGIVAQAFGDGGFLVERARAIGLGRHELQGGVGLRDLGARQIDRRLRGGHRRLGHACALRVQQRRRRRSDHGDNRLLRHDRVARMQADPPQFAADRGRDGEDLADAGLALFLDPDLDGARPRPWPVRPRQAAEGRPRRQARSARRRRAQGQDGAWIIPLSSEPRPCRGC